MGKLGKKMKHLSHTVGKEVEWGKAGSLSQSVFHCRGKSFLRKGNDKFTFTGFGVGAHTN